MGDPCTLSYRSHWSHKSHPWIGLQCTISHVQPADLLRYPKKIRNFWFFFRDLDAMGRGVPLQIA